MPICFGKYVHFRFPFTPCFRYNFIVYAYPYKTVGGVWESGVYAYLKSLIDAKSFLKLWNVRSVR